MVHNVPTVHTSGSVVAGTARGSGMPFLHLHCYRHKLFLDTLVYNQKCRHGRAMDHLSNLKQKQVYLVL